MKKTLLILFASPLFSIAQSNTFPASGNVGIGVSSPSEKLEVRGNIKFIRGTGGSNFIGIHQDASGNYITSDDPGTNHKNMIIQVSPTAPGKTDRHLYFRTGKNSEGNFLTRMIVRGNGNVGIGTVTPDSELSVNGVIHSKEVKVDLNGWSDFVFDKEYELPTLEEVEQHIEEKGHLKDIPSAAEVVKNGILLGEMNARLLQKIEELTLYTIHLQKQVKVLIKQNERQQQEIDEFKKQ
ncbi:hypothetical protein [Sinomicrobium sp. M5D2P9]